MCGIAGILHLDKERKADKLLLKRMTDTLVHRGPDGAGYFFQDNIGLGHRRLSIIDLNTGDQPMYNDDKSVALVFNGEIIIIAYSLKISIQVLILLSKK
jgi:asparagine synthase (glutamine-hydrolysing)